MVVVEIGDREAGGEGEEEIQAHGEAWRVLCIPAASSWCVGEDGIDFSPS